MNIQDNILAFQKCHDQSINYNFRKGNRFSAYENTPFEENMLILLSEKKNIPYHQYVASNNGFNKLTPLYAKYWDEIAQAYRKSIADTHIIKEEWINYLTGSLNQSYFQELNILVKVFYNKDFFESKELLHNYSFIKNLYCGFYPQAKKIYKSGKISLRPFQSEDQVHFKDKLEGILDKLIEMWSFFFKIQLIDIIEVSALYINNSDSLLSIPGIQNWEDQSGDNPDEGPYKLKGGHGHKQNAEAINKKYMALRKENIYSTQEEIIQKLQAWYKSKLEKEIDEGTIRYHLGLKK